MSTLSSGLPEEVNAQEDLARFLVKSGDFSSQSVKPSAFLPNPKDRETSISRHGKTPEDVLWELGKIAAGERTLYGAAIFKAQAVRNAKLLVDSFEPPPRHAVITGWPWIENDPDEQKAQQKLLAILLVQAAGMPFLRGKA